MDKEELLRYRNILKEIELLREQYIKINPEMTMDSVKGSISEFPYTECNFKLEGIDKETYNSKISRLEKKIAKKMHELIEEKDKLLSYIYSVEDSCLRQIMIYRYIDGLTWNDIGNKMGYAEVTIRKKHSEFLKCIA
jgi:DNA-directed RNA polymerase specialized sigma subunit